MENKNFKTLNSVDLQQIEGGGIGGVIRAGKKLWSKAKSHIDDFVAGWNEA